MTAICHEPAFRGSFAKADASSLLPISITHVNSHITKHAGSTSVYLLHGRGLQTEYTPKRLQQGPESLRSGPRDHDDQLMNPTGGWRELLSELLGDE